jgi:hypothetical protein
VCRLLIITNYRAPVEKPDNMPDEYWAIIEPMVRLKAEERQSPEEV